MRIKTIKIDNFRSIRGDEIECTDFNTFVGTNGSGKSTLLNALNVFFGEINTFTDDDFFDRRTKESIRIQVTFDQLSDAAVEDFSHYVRGGKLVVQVEVKKDSNGSFQKTVRGERLVFPPLMEYFQSKSAKERGRIFKDLCSEFSLIEPATNDADREKSLIEFEDSLTDERKELVLSGAEFFGVSKGVDRFRRHICWVYVPAVKEAASESEEAKTTHLGRLIQHTIRSGMDYESELENIRSDAAASYAKLLDTQRSHLSHLQDKLSERLRNVVTGETDLTLEWKKDERSVAVQDPIAKVLLHDRGFEGEVDKFGHGLQRSFLLIILQELMAADSSVKPTLLLGCEEPELYQHPPQARHLAEILSALSSEGQIFITTHSPYFINLEHYDGIKMFRKTKGEARTSFSKFSAILHSYNQAFEKPLRNDDQVRTKLAIQTQPKYNELFFAEKVVLVEGISDLACLETFLRLSGRRTEFQRSGSAILVCEGKSSLALLLLIVKDFGIPYHVIFDCDSDCDVDKVNVHVRDNDAILSTAGHVKLGVLPTSDICTVNVTAWQYNIEEKLKQEYGASRQECQEAGSNAVGHLKNSRKNPVYIAAAMKAAWDNGVRFQALADVIDRIVESHDVRSMDRCGSAPMRKPD